MENIKTYFRDGTIALPTEEKLNCYVQFFNNYNWQDVAGHYVYQMNMKTSKISYMQANKVKQILSARFPLIKFRIFIKAS